MPILTPLPVYIGVDPGVSGGIAWRQGKQVVASAMPDTLIEAWDLFIAIPDISNAKAVLEQVTGWQGGNKKKDGSEATHGGAPGSHMFKFGQAYGHMEAFLTVLLIPTQWKIPRVWQKIMSIPKWKDERKIDYKRRLKEKAQELFPDLGVTLKTCDALLIMEACRKLHEG